MEWSEGGREECNEVLRCMFKTLREEECISHCIFINLSVCLSVCQCVCLSVCQSVCLRYPHFLTPPTSNQYSRATFQPPYHVTLHPTQRLPQPSLLHHTSSKSPFHNWNSPDYPPQLYLSSFFPILSFPLLFRFRTCYPLHHHLFSSPLLSCLLLFTLLSHYFFSCYFIFLIYSPVLSSLLITSSHYLPWTSVNFNFYFNNSPSLLLSLFLSLPSLLFSSLIFFLPFYLMHSSSVSLHPTPSLPLSHFSPCVPLALNCSQPRP
jgi:hypothetical protein